VVFRAKTIGFTLIEILIVVVIVSVLTVMGVQMVNSGSVERNLQQQGKIFKSSLYYVCDQATFGNRAYGVVFSENSYSFSYFVNHQWLAAVETNNLSRTLTAGLVFDLQIEGQTIVLSSEIENIEEAPQIMCNSMGELTPFRLTIKDATGKHRYQLATTSFWEIEGQWLEENQTNG